MKDVLESIRFSAEGDPLRVAVTCAGRRLTYRDLEDRATQVATSLAARAEPGERVAYLARSTVDYFVFVVAALKSQVVPTPINWRLAPPEIVAILADADCRLLIVDAEQRERLGKAIADSALVLDVDIDTDLAGWSTSDAPRGLVSHVDASATVLQIYTSGTTGQPKGVMISGHGLASYLDVLAEIARIDREAVTLTSLPLFHVGGTCWVLSALMRGATSVIMPAFEAAEMAHLVETEGVTTLLAVPAIINSLLVEPSVGDRDLSTLATLYYGAGPITPTNLDAALARWDCDFVQGFGLTECGIALSLGPQDHRKGAHLLESCGRPIPGAEARLVDPDTLRDVPDGEVGELWIRSPVVMSGYWHRPEETRLALGSDGWLRTGDAASRDDEGYYYLRDRLKDVIISGGENVYSGEVENVLAQHPAVAECAVIGVPSERWTETVKALIVVRPGHAVATEDLIAYCRERLARYKVPTSVHVVESLPRTPSGKLLKFELRQAYRSGLA